MARSEASLKRALKMIPELRAEFWKNVNVTGSGADLNQELEKAGRVADFLEFAELLTRDALQRDESCGAHFRAEKFFLRRFYFPIGKLICIKIVEGKEEPSRANIN
jgi:succinate dehydrogenase/fumarate reductase flavoprotein subunit